MGAIWCTLDGTERIQIYTLHHVWWNCAHSICQLAQWMCLQMYECFVMRALQPHNNSKIIERVRNSDVVCKRWRCVCVCVPFGHAARYYHYKMSGKRHKFYFMTTSWRLKFYLYGRFFYSFCTLHQYMRAHTAHSYICAFDCIDGYVFGVWEQKRKKKSAEFH